MKNYSNLQIYHLWAPLYDLFFQPFFAQPRQTLIAVLRPQPGERWLIPGVGTGQDLDYMPPDSVVIAGDLSPAMLTKAMAKSSARSTAFHYVDAQQLPFADECFDGILLNLILSVVPDGTRAFHEAWRVLKPGGRIGIFDKFIPPGQTLTPLRNTIGFFVRQLGTDPNRRLEEITDGFQDLELVRRQPSVVAGQYQLIWLHKRAEGTNILDAARR